MKLLPIISGLMSSSILLANAEDVRERSKTQCAGTEPFWNLVIDDQNITFTLSGSEAHKYDLTNRSSYAGMLAEYAEAFDGSSVSGDNISVSIINRSCSDRMSDYTWQYSTYVKVNGSYYLGCCGSGTM